jgi:hypothetical protein
MHNTCISRLAPVSQVAPTAKARLSHSVRVASSRLADLTGIANLFQLVPAAIDLCIRMPGKEGERGREVRYYHMRSFSVSSTSSLQVDM